MTIELQQGVRQLLWAVCHDCKKKHPIVLRSGVQDGQLTDWWVKHEGHRVEYRQEDPLSLKAASSGRAAPWQTIKGWFRRLSGKGAARRFDASLPFMSYDPNTNDLTAYASSAAFTFTLTSLGNSTTLVTGRESTAISNISNLYYDYLVGGYAVVSGTVNATLNSTIELWGYAAQDDTPTYPSLVTTGITGTDANINSPTVGVKTNALSPIASLLVDATTQGRQYNCAPLYVSGVYGGNIPKKWGLALFQNTGILHASAAGVWSQTGQYFTS